jgi:DUF2075 family protein
MKLYAGATERFVADATMHRIAEIGCVYTPQGFEFDYIGVTWGCDVGWDPASNDWIGDPSESHDSIVKRSDDRFTDLAERTYRVLLTRGLKGCYVYFDDNQTKHKMRSSAGGTLPQLKNGVLAWRSLSC